jgi:hypothetical protein
MHPGGRTSQGLATTADQADWQQFRCLRSHDPNPREWTGWVSPVKFDMLPPPHVLLPGCRCIKFYAVELFDDEAHERIRLALPKGQFFYVCTCYGEFAE